MIEWKHLQLSSEDYQNFINNEDEELMKINDLNINEWQQLYRSAQMRSLQNKQLKTNILSYENNLKRITSDYELKINKKEAQRQYFQFNNDLKVRLSELYSQLDLLHLKNVSTTVELIISRLLCIEEDLVVTLTESQTKMHCLQLQLDEAQLAKKFNICSECREHIEKTKYKYLKNQILAGEEPSRETEKENERAGPENERTEEENEIAGEKIKKYMRDEMNNEQNQYEMKRIHYLYDLEEALRNKDKTLQYTNTPLHSMLEDYLHHTLQILEAKKVNFAPKNIGEFGRVSQSYDVLEEMKKMFNNKEFLKNISELLEKPFANFGHKLKRSIQKSLHPTEGFMCDVEVQTNYIKEFQTIAHLDKQMGKLAFELETIRASKNKMENELISNLEAFHKYEMKNMELNNKNRQLQILVSKLETESEGLKKRLEMTQQNQKEERNKLIETNLVEKSTILYDLRKLEGELKRLKSDKLLQTSKIVQRTEFEVQTDPVNFQSPELKTLNTEEGDTRKSHKKAKLRGQKTHKRISIQLQPKKNVKVNQLLKMAVEDALKRESRSVSRNRKGIQFQRASQESRTMFSRQNFTKRSRIKMERQAQVLRFNTINPSIPLCQEAKQCSQEMLTPPMSHFRAESSVLIGEGHHTRRIHKLSDVKRGHVYHKSDFICPSNQFPTPSVSQAQIQSQMAAPQALPKGLPANKVKYAADAFFEQFQFKNERNLSSKDNICGDSEQRLNMGPDIYREMAAIQEQFLRQSDNKENKVVQSSGRIIKGSNFHNLNKTQITFLEQFFQFCVIHYKSLSQLNAFQIIYDLEAESEPNNQHQQKKPSKPKTKPTDRHPSHSKEHLHLTDPKIVKACLELFLGVEEASKYERKVGFWGELDHCIMVDNYYGNQCDKIQGFFSQLRAENPEFYNQYADFLIKPMKILMKSDSKGQRRGLKTITETSSSVEREGMTPLEIKKVFKKIFSFHKMVHKRCNHVNHFLALLGFSP